MNVNLLKINHTNRFLNTIGVKLITLDHTTSNTDGGSFFAYQIPKSCWKTQEWKRSIIATDVKSVVNWRV